MGRIANIFKAAFSLQNDNEDYVGLIIDYDEENEVLRVFEGDVPADTLAIPCGGEHGTILLLTLGAGRFVGVVFTHADAEFAAWFRRAVQEAGDAH